MTPVESREQDDSVHEVWSEARCVGSVWHVHGVRTTRGKAEFDTEIENPNFEGSPELTVDRTFEAGDVFILTGTGVGHHKQAGRFAFVYSDLFTFRGDLIAEVESYVVPIG